DGSSRGNHCSSGPEAQGRCRLAGSEPARYEVDVQAAGYGSWKGEPQEYRVGEPSFEIALVHACAIQLIVRDERGQPLNRSTHVECHDLDGRALSFDW